MAGTLYVIATPLGNLEDFSVRAVRTLREVDVVYAEDTRRSRVLLDHYGVDKPLISLHEHNERERVAQVAARLAEGKSAALLTDAGTPAVSDPGAALVSGLVALGGAVSPIPGPSALATALSVAGFVADDVLFVGFLPVKGRERARALGRVTRHRGVVVLFEAPHRLLDTARELAEAEAERPSCLCRELTKLHEELRRGTLAELAVWAAGEVRGELTLVLGPSARVEQSADEAAVDAALSRCFGVGLTARDAATAVAAVLERPRREVYERCLAVKRQG